MLNLNQKGLAHILVVLILLAGIIVGVYLVQHPQIFKSKAYEVNIPFNQYDQPPALIVSTADGAQGLLKDAGSTAGYRVSFSETEDEITIGFEPNELTEEEAKNYLNQADKYYLRTLMWLLYDPFNAIDGPPIDAWYAFCDHLNPEVLARVGAEPTILADGKWLQCLDPPPTIDQFNPTNGKRFFLYKKIAATVLAKMIETSRLQRENKSLSENAKDFAFSMIPVLGPTINAIRNPGSDPDAVAQETIVNSLLEVLTSGAGPVIKPAAEGGGKLLVSLASRIKAKFVIPYFRNVPSSQYGDFATEVAKASSQLKNQASLVVKLLPDNVITKPNVRRKIIRLTGSQIINDAYEQLFTDLGVIYGHISPWTRQHIIAFDRIEQVLWKKRSDILFLKDADYDILVSPLGLPDSAGVYIRHINPQKSLVVVRSSVESNTVAHETTHFIQDLHRFANFFAEEQYRTTAGYMTTEGLTDWIWKAKRGYAAAYNQEVGQIEIMIARLNNKGVDGAAAAEYSALTGNSRYFLELYERYVGDLDMRGIFADFYNIRRAQGLVPPLIFLNSLDTEEDASVEDIQIDIPPEPVNPPSASNFLNCSYSQEDSNCLSGATVCTGHTDDAQCAGKRPEECFNIVYCQYDANNGSTCRCSQ